MLSETVPNEISERFDIVFSDGLFEHFSFDDQDKIMKNFVSLLSDDGLIVTFVPNRFSPWQIIRPFYMPGIKEMPFVLDELIDMNERNGLKVVDYGGINVLPFSVSPEQVIGKYFGMLLYTVSKIAK